MTQQEKRDNFYRVAGKRQRKIIHMIDSFQNLGKNTGFYAYTDEEISTLFDDIIEACVIARKAMKKRDGKAFHLEEE